MLRVPECLQLQRKKLLEKPQWDSTWKASLRYPFLEICLSKVEEVEERVERKQPFLG